MPESRSMAKQTPIGFGKLVHVHGVAASNLAVYLSAHAGGRIPMRPAVLLLSAKSARSSSETPHGACDAIRYEAYRIPTSRPRGRGTDRRSDQVVEELAWMSPDDLTPSAS